MNKYLKNIINDAKNEYKNSKGFPVFAAMLMSDSNVIWNSRSNKELINSNCRHHVHAEYIISQNYDVKGKEIFVSIIPCSHCLKILIKLEVRKIYYLLNFRSKATRKTWLENKDKLEKVNINFDLFDWYFDTLVEKFKQPGHRKSKKNLIKKYGSIVKAFK